MSLQIWLPLNGNLTNYGLSDLTFSNVNATYTASATPGKIGPNCYSNSSASGGGLISNKTINLGTKQSMFCWIKFTSLTASSSLGLGACGQHRYPSFTGMGLTIKYISASSGYLSVNTGTGTDRTYNRYCGNTLLYTNKWYHIGYTYDGTTIKLYVNGIEDGSHAVSGLSMPADYCQVFGWSFGSSSGTGIYGGYQTVGSINDVRMYDHCVSATEVFEIAKGLLLHYKLDDIVGDNLISTMKSGGRSTLINKYTLDINFGQNEDAYGYFTMATPLVLDTTYTLSFDVSNFPSGGIWSWRLWNTVNYEFNITQNGHYSYTFTPTTSKLPSGYSLTEFLFDDGGRTNPANIVTFSNFKIEIGPIDTPWVPNGENINSVPDCSGNNYHGTVVGSIIMANDSIRHKGCIYQADARTNYIASQEMTFPTYSITMSCWIKSSTTGYSGYHIPLSFNGSDYEMSIDGSGYFRNGFSIGGSRVVHTTSHNSILDGKWHMITATYDGSTIRRYVDGVELTGYAHAVSGSLSGATGKKLLVGNYNGTTYGNKNMYTSDVRIYSEALTANEVKRLYQVSASVGNDGTFYAHQFIEDNTINETVNQNGIVKSNNFNEIDAPIGTMKVKALPDGSAWARIHWLDVSSNSTFFINATEVADCDLANRYSKMGIVDKFKNSSGVYEFMLTYPRLSSTGYNRWTQTSSPNATTVTGYTAKSISWSAHSAGIRTMSGSSIYNCDSGSTWYAPIGQTVGWTNNSIPGADGSQQFETELWVRIDTLSTNDKVSIYENEIQTFQIYEI